MPSVSQKQRAFIFATKGKKFAREHHFDNKGELPKYSPNSKKRKRKRSAENDEMIRRFQKRHGKKKRGSQAEA